MSDVHRTLSEHRDKIDAIDEKILSLLEERKNISLDILQTKRENTLPIYVPAREKEKIDRFRQQAIEHGLDDEWAEDFLRMIMGSSRASQSMSTFPRSSESEKTILFVGGRGGMGSLYGRISEASGYVVRNLEKGDWDRVKELVSGVHMVVVTVPINITEQVIQDIVPYMDEGTILADFTSNKSSVLKKMMTTWDGPVLGLHPMHGPDVGNLSRQLMMVCVGRDAAASQWYVDQCELWGMRVKHVDPDKHDHAMHLIQGLRHFVALLHGSFMQKYDLKPEDMIDFSSPIYRAELMMTGRIFAQDPELYADIVFSNRERLELLESFRQHHNYLAEMVIKGDKEAFIREFSGITSFFGDFAPQALHESGYLINRLADRFA
jgi:chorismate mutase / prephenate dehydrogenase